jgi:hypothetical protein
MDKGKLKELERRAVMFVLEKGKKVKEAVSSFAAPKGPQSKASDVPLKTMEGRKQKLDEMGGQNTGGMFDIIYKKRKEREDALKDFE